MKTIQIIFVLLFTATFFGGISQTAAAGKMTTKNREPLPGLLQESMMEPAPMQIAIINHSTVQDFSFSKKTFNLN